MITRSVCGMDRGVPARRLVVRWWLIAVALAVMPTAGSLAVAQMGALVIENARVLRGDGTELERGALLVRGEKIVRVAEQVNAPMFAQRVDASGKVVTPGLIDAWSALGVRDGSREGKAAGLALDNFDRYARDELTAALRQGVTAIYVPGQAGEGIGGIGAVVRLLPGGTREDAVLLERAALGTSIGAAAGTGTLARVRTAEAVRKAFREAREYREALEDYEEKLEEYLEKLGKQEDAKPEEKAEDEKGEGDDGAAFDPDAARRKNGGRNDKQQDAEQKKKEKPGPKKPEKPPRDLDKETLLDVLDGKLRWRVEAYAPADVLNALEIAEEYNLALVIEGATGAWQVAELLAERRVPVVFGAETAPLAYVGDRPLYAEAEAIERLRAAGVALYLGTGPARGGESATPQLALRAAQAVGDGMGEAAALQAVTGGAAELLGVGDKLGRLDGGMAADFVIWTDRPFAPGARVERVYVRGELVYESADQDENGKEGE